MKKIKVGDIVRLKKRISKDQNTAKVVLLLIDPEGGIKLDKHLDGFRYWNVDDVVIVSRKNNHN